MKHRAMLTLDVSLTRVLDLCDSSVRSVLEVDMDDLRRPWLREQNVGHFPLTQRLGTAARDEQFEAILAPSAADEPRGIILAVLPETMLRTSVIIAKALVPRRLPFVIETLRGRMTRP
jgi:RES domain-containing protein